MSTVREEISRVRWEIICLGGEWDITWSLPKLNKELDELKSQHSSRFARAPPQSKATIRHYILYLTLDRLTMFERDLLPGLCKVRISTVCPTSSRFPISEESKFAFKPGLTIHRENSGFKILIPLVSGSPCPKNQLKEWKIEFEILHRFPAAPIYGVVARGWTDPWTLANAKCIDLPSPEVPPPYVDYTGQEINPFHLKPVARLDFVEEKTKCVFNVNIWRSAVKAIVFAHRLVRQTKQTKRTSLEKLERDIRLLNAKNSNEKELMQMDLMMRTIGVMNEFLVAGAAGKLGQTATAAGVNGQSWLSSWLPPATTTAPAGAPPVDLTSIEKRIDELRDAIQAVQKSVHEKHQNRSVEPKPKEITAPKSVAELLSSRRESVSRGTVLTRAVHAHAPDTSASQSRTESMISTPPVDPTEPTESVPESPTETGGIAGAWSNAVNAFWGATTAAAAKSEVEHPSPKAVSKPKIPTIRKPVVEPPKAEEIADVGEEDNEDVVEVPVKRPVPTSPKKSVGAVKKVPMSKSSSPPKKVPMRVVAKPKPKPPPDPAKAKAEMIVKLKVLEAKRKAEIEKREAELVSFSKKIPPVDRYKFPGMPGPPPFKPKKAAVEPDPVSLLPTALAGNDGEEFDTDDQGGE